MTEAANTRGRAHVVTVSDRSAAGVRADASGPAAARTLSHAGFAVAVSVVPDGAASVAVELTRVIADGARLVVTCGGTGISPTDRTPEGTREVLDRDLPGVAEEVRRRGTAASAHAVLSRGLAGVVDPGPLSAQGALVVNLPGKPAAVTQGLEVVLPLVGHVLSQLEGGDH